MSTTLEKPSKLQKLGGKLSTAVKRLGNPISTILLDFPSQIFTIPDIDGLIGFQLINNCAIVMGDPVCLPEQIPELTQAFHHHGQNQNWTIVYLLASETFANWAIHNTCKTLIQVGEELILDPTQFKLKQKLRWKINQSIQVGVIVKEYRDFDAALETRMKEAINLWLKAKHGPQIYLGNLNPFENNANKRIFYAVQGETIVGLLALSRIDQHKGWVVTSFMAIPEAPVGVTEHLMSSILDVLTQENCHFLCLGAISGTNLGQIVGLNVFRRFLARLIFSASKWFFHLDTRKEYFHKYHPSHQPTYLLFSGNLRIRELIALKKILHVKFFS